MAISLREMSERIRVAMDPARKLVEEAIATGKPKLVLEKGQRRLVFSAGFDDTPYRCTSFDAIGPVGHRDYSASQVHMIVGEVHSALRSGFTVRES